ncbi:ubiquitin-conjugating enzyme E2-binding protein [Phyllosticta citriasiana]|uniref:ubiquitin-conjugating enzyme E2-binding protein n=1 Tax=Phyllosticta citriasiana TaxID=595635 RepID=UPI0030FD710B
MTRPPSPSAKPSSILHLYAELLLHIRTVTLFASLRTAHTSETKAVLSADGETLTLTHEGHSASIRLPTQIAGGGSAALMLPQAPSKELTLRLQLKEKSPGLLRLRQGAENVVPWDAQQLEKAESVKCAKCGAQLAVANPERNHDESDPRSEVANGGNAESTRVGVKSWLDLPNENWAEMMDFWHCHKPHEHNHGDHSHEGHEKGYAASNRLIAKKGVGFVDLAYLLLAEEDCIGVKLVTHSSLDQQSHLLCSSCYTQVGLFDHRSNGFRLWKGSLSVVRKGRPSPQSYSPIKWISAQLLSLIDNQGVRKSTVVADDEPQASKVNEGGESLEPIEIWVFTPDLSFSSSVPHARESDGHGTADPTRAMKVMWKPAPHLKPDHEQGQALDRLSLSVEEARLPVHVFAELKKRLRSSGAWIPASAKKMGEWNVGLLERFAEDEA